MLHKKGLPERPGTLGLGELGGTGSPWKMGSSSGLLGTSSKPTKNMGHLISQHCPVPLTVNLTFLVLFLTPETFQ